MNPKKLEYKIYMQLLFSQHIWIFLTLRVRQKFTSSSPEGLIISRPNQAVSKTFVRATGPTWHSPKS